MATDDPALHVHSFFSGLAEDAEQLESRSGGRVRSIGPAVIALSALIVLVIAAGSVGAYLFHWATTG